MTSHAIRLLILMFPMLALGQEKPVRHTLRILPLGDPPPFKQEVRDGARYEIPPAEGTIPPRQLEVVSTAEEKETLTLRLRLGSVSTPLEFTLPEVRQVETKQGATTWLKIPLSSSEASLALVWRNGPDWNKAAVLTIPDGAADRSRGDCRFINVTAKPMGIVLGSERLKLAPGTALMRSLPAEAPDIAMTILYPAADGSLQPCLSTKITRNASMLQQFVIYAADEKQPRMPVKVLPLEEAR